jgi:hypothetical protein
VHIQVIASPTENELIVTNPTAARLQPEAMPTTSIPATPLEPAIPAAPPAPALPAEPFNPPAAPLMPAPPAPSPPAASPFGGEPAAPQSGGTEAEWVNPHAG